MTETIATRAIVVERTLPYPPKKIWRTLTDPALISQWLMPNDFQPVVGHRFNFRTKPQGDWDGVVDCEVLEIMPAKLQFCIPHPVWHFNQDDNGLRWRERKRDT